MYQPSTLEILAIRSCVNYIFSAQKNNVETVKDLLLVCGYRVSSLATDLLNHGSWCRKNKDNTYNVLEMIENEDTLCLNDLYTTRQLKTWPQFSMERAITIKSVHMMDFLKRHGCPWEEENMFTAAKDGALTCLQYAIKYDCPYSKHGVSTAIDIAAVKGQILCLQELIDSGFSTINIVWHAVYGGHFDCVVFSIEKKLPYNYISILTCAARRLFFDQSRKKDRLKCFLYVWSLKSVACLTCEKYLLTTYYTSADMKTFIDGMEFAYQRRRCYDGFLYFILNVGRDIENTLFL